MQCPVPVGQVKEGRAAEDQDPAGTVVEGIGELKDVQHGLAAFPAADYPAGNPGGQGEWADRDNGGDDVGDSQPVVFHSDPIR